MVGKIDAIKLLLPIYEEYFWLGIKRDMDEYISKCMKCQQVKVEHQHLVGLLRHFPISEWKWEISCMDFITSLLMTVKQHNSMMVVVDKLSKSAHFVPIKYTYKTYAIARIFMK